jgi:hypothetical protein
MTRIHVAVVGLVRHFSFTFPSIVANVFEQLNKLTPTSLSFHLSRTRKALGNPRTGEFSAPEYQVEHLLAGFSHRFFELDDIRDENDALYRQVLAQDRNADDSPGSTLASNDRALIIRNYVEFLALLKLSQEVLESNPADVYLFVRPDLYYPEPFYLAPYQELISSHIFTPLWGIAAGTNDRFAFVPKSFVPQYFGRLDNLFEWMTKTQEFQPKTHLEWTLRDTPHLKVLPFEAIRVRTGQMFSRTDLKRIAKSRPDIDLPRAPERNRSLWRLLARHWSRFSML